MNHFLQSGAPVEMADAFRADGKIYVVITVLGIIFACLTLYLVYLDRRIKNIESQK